MPDDRFGTPAPGGAGPEDLDSSFDAPAAQSAESLEGLRAEVAARSREAAEAHERYLRTLADFDNHRKRVARDREDWGRQAQEQLLREILPVLDNFDRALALAPDPVGDASFRAGVELIHRDFLKALERFGVRPFSAVGERFDPQRHEAVARVERTDVADHSIVCPRSPHTRMTSPTW